MGNDSNLDKIKSLEDRISKLKVTIKQLGDDVILKDNTISSLNKQIEKEKNSRIGLELQLSQVEEQLNRIKKTKELKVCEVELVNNIVKDLQSKIDNMHKDIRSGDLNYQQSDIGKITRQLNEQIKINSDLRDKIEQIKDENSNSYNQQLRYEQQIDSLKDTNKDLKIDLREARDNIEQLKLSEYEKQQKIRELELDNQDKEELINKLQIKNKKTVRMAILIVVLATVIASAILLLV